MAPPKKHIKKTSATGAAAKKPAASNPTPIDKNKTVCPECKLTSTKTKIMHENWCKFGEQADQERGDKPGFRKATVDGADAVITYRGKEIPLVELTDEQLVDIVVDMQDEVDRKTLPAKKATEALKKAKDNLDYAVAQLVKRRRNEKGQERLPLGEK